jgi:hypothetical protein
LTLLSEPRQPWKEWQKAATAGKLAAERGNVAFRLDAGQAVDERCVAIVNAAGTNSISVPVPCDSRLFCSMQFPSSLTLWSLF